jgi:undecaprenyl-diphosphatase
MEALRRFDYRLTKFIQSRSPAWRPVMAGVSLLGHPTAVLLIGLVALLSAVQRGQTAIARAFVYAALAYGINTSLKLVLHRRRPHDLRITTLGLRSYSFPSGHAFGAVIFYGLFSYLDYKYLARPFSALLVVLLWILILLIGLSRVYLKAHYPSDVIGGWLLGGLSLLIIIRLVF